MQTKFNSHPFCLPLPFFPYLSLRQAVNPSGEGVSHTGSSLVVSIINVTDWCEVQADEILRDGVYPSFPLPSPIPTSIHFSFEDTLDAVVILSWPFPYHLSLDSFPSLQLYVNKCVQVTTRLTHHFVSFLFPCSGK